MRGEPVESFQRDAPDANHAFPRLGDRERRSAIARAALEQSLQRAGARVDVERARVAAVTVVVTAVVRAAVRAVYAAQIRRHKRGAPAPPPAPPRVAAAAAAPFEQDDAAGCDPIQRRLKHRRSAAIRVRATSSTPSLNSDAASSTPSSSETHPPGAAALAHRRQKSASFLGCATPVVWS